MKQNHFPRAVAHGVQRDSANGCLILSTSHRNTDGAGDSFTTLDKLAALVLAGTLAYTAFVLCLIARLVVGIIRLWLL